MTKIEYKALTINECWQGRRFKTKKYLKYEKDLLYMLPKMRVPDPPFKLTIIVGVSNICSDIDNILKPFIDILQKRYRFNDRDIYELSVFKEKVKKGKEFINFEINHIEQK